MTRAAMKVRHPNRVRHEGWGRLVGRSRLPCSTCVRVPGGDVDIGTWLHCRRSGQCEVKVIRFGPKGTHYSTDGSTKAGPWVNAIATRKG